MNDSKIRELEPGTCADGSARIRGYERRTHGDHNARHGGQFFMADDNWHHLEGTFVRPNIFRVYFYDDFTRPLAITGFSASVAKTDSYFRETDAAIAVKPGRVAGRNTLEVPVPVTTLPISFALRIKFKADDKERVFNFTFADYSREPRAPAAPRTLTAAASATAAPAAPAASPAQPPTQAPASPANAGAVPPAPAAAAGTSIAPAEPLPTTTPELLAELATRAQSLKTLMDQGNLSAVWYPAIRAKNIALALEENHINDVPEARRPSMESAVKRLTMASWQIDAAGDLGNVQLLQPLYRNFSAAIDDIQRVYGTR
jgi:hypothetical protein